MGRKFQEITIDDEVYTFTMLRAKISTKILVRIFKLFGPPVGKAFPSTIKMKDILDVGIDL